MKETINDTMKRFVLAKQDYIKEGGNFITFEGLNKLILANSTGDLFRYTLTGGSSEI